MVIIDLGAGRRPAKDTPEAYERRTIVHDAQRAARMRDPMTRACSWEPNTPQYVLWCMTYVEALHG